MQPLAIVLMPGLHGTALLFAPLLNALPSWLRPRMITYPSREPLGYDSLQQLAAACLPGNEPFVLLAESFSSPLAVRLCAEKPAGLVGLVLAGAFVRKPIGGWSSLGARVVGPWMFNRAPPPAFIRRFLLDETCPDASADAVAAALREVSPVVLARRVRETLSVDATAAYRDVAAPMLLLHASRERLLAREVRAEMARLRPDADHLTLDAPHLMLQTHPAESAALIASFCLKVSQAVQI